MTTTTPTLPVPDFTARRISETGAGLIVFPIIGLVIANRRMETWKTHHRVGDRVEIETGSIPWKDLPDSPPNQIVMAVTVTSVEAKMVREFAESDAAEEWFEQFHTHHDHPSCRISSAHFNEDGVCVEPEDCACGDFTYAELFETWWKAEHPAYHFDTAWAWLIGVRAE